MLIIQLIHIAAQNIFKSEKQFVGDTEPWSIFAFRACRKIYRILSNVDGLQYFLQHFKVKTKLTSLDEAVMFLLNFFRLRVTIASCILQIAFLAESI